VMTVIIIISVLMLKDRCFVDEAIYYMVISSWSSIIQTKTGIRSAETD